MPGRAPAAMRLLWAEQFIARARDAAAPALSIASFIGLVVPIVEVWALLFLKCAGRRPPAPIRSRLRWRLRQGPGGQQFCPGRSLHEDAAMLEVKAQFNRTGLAASRNGFH